MPPDGQVDLAHPEAADWVLGTLDPAKTEEFNSHLTSCRHCQAAVAEFGQMRQMLQNLPPAVEPPPHLQARTIASVIAAVAEDRAATQVHQIPEAPPELAEPGAPTQVHQIPQAPPAAAEDRAATQVHQIPQAPPVPAEDRAATQVHQIPQAPPAPAEPGAPIQVHQIPPTRPEADDNERPGGAGAKIIRFPRWRGHVGLYAIAGAVAAAVIAAVVILPTLGGGSPADTATFQLRSPTGQAASGTATTRPDATGSWDVTLTVHGLKNLGAVDYYECWYATPGKPGHRQLVSAGTFIVGNDGGGTFSMTSGVDPDQFKTMEITAESPDSSGAQHGPVILSGSAKLV